MSRSKVDVHDENLAPLRAIVRYFPSIIAVLTVLLACLVLFGWAFDLSYPKSVVPGLATMKANSALCFIAAALALLILRSHDSRWRLMGLGLAAFSILVASLSLGENIFGRSLGIDELLFRDPRNLDGVHPGRMSPATAINFVFLGFALVSLDVKPFRTFYPSQLFALLLILSSFLALVGYLLGAKALYSVKPFSSIALHTASAFFLLGFGVLYTRPERGVLVLTTSQTSGGWLVRRHLPETILILLTVGWFALSGEQSGLYPTEFGVALMVSVNVIVLGYLILRTGEHLHDGDLSHQRIEECLRQSEELLRLFIEQTKDHALITLDSSGIVRMWNSGATCIYQYEAAEAIGRPYNEFFLSQDVAVGKPQRGLEEAAARGQFGEEGWQVRKDGSRFWANGSLTALFKGTYLLGFAKITRDLTERKEAEETLRLRDRAMQAVSQGIIITDPNLPDNSIVYVSEGFERLTGYSFTEIIGKNCRFLQGKDTDPKTVSDLREAIAAGRACSVEILNYRKNGTPFWNLLSLTPIRNERGSPTYFVGVQVDITERKNSEAQLRQAQKMEAVGQLAGGVAQDFNNLLTVILGHSEILLKQTEAGDSKRDMLSGISEAGVRAASLTRQLLAFGRNALLQPLVLNLNEKVLERKEMCQRLIGNNIELKLVLEPGIHAIKFDPSYLDQVVMNLLLNARDAMPKGGILTLETRNVDVDDSHTRLHADLAPGTYVMLAVTDTGRGMTAETKSHIFEPFFTTKDIGKGTGLGLAVVHGIIKQSGGHVEVHSEPHQGTTFKVYFSRVKIPSEVIQNKQEPIKSHVTETILLVEDDDGVRSLARFVLQSHGYTVLEAKDGKKALQIAEVHGNAIHLLLTNVVMPEMGGRQIADKLRPRFPDMRVLFTSSYTDDAVMRHGVVEAQVAFLQKPYSPDTLNRKVRQILDGQ